MASRSRVFPLDSAWRVLLRDLGVRPQDLLIRAGLPGDLFSRQDAALETQEYFRLWEALETEVADPTFPLRLADTITTEAFVPPLFAALCSPNLGVAVRRISTYKRLMAPMALEVSEDSQGMTLTLKWLDALVPPPSSLVAAELAFLVLLARKATRENVRPVFVEFPVLPQPEEAYSRWFGRPILSGKEAAVRFSLSDARRPFLTFNEAVWAAFEPGLRKRLAEMDATAPVSERVKAVLIESLPSGQASVDQVAERLALSSRTLQRRLKNEGRTFQGLLHQTRENLARHYLRKTECTSVEIAFLLGYEDPNSFFRAFHEWTGETPSGVRQA